ncbi:MAG: phosphate ABC transporter permease PstA [Deltaproteobacteria bacterium]|nr:phosphate ABC transporter permease PstA [Deltaproteobacteria bacterium]
MLLLPRTAQTLMKTLLWALTGFTLLILIFIIVDISIKGLPQVTLGFLSQEPQDMGRHGGIFSTIVATAYITVLAILLAAPFGVGTAIYLTEYTREGWTTRIIRFGAECLAGVPSIILGLFGFVLFVMKLGFGWSVISGALTLGIMVLPIIIRTSEEAIKAVPQEYREACYTLGMSQWQTITRIVLPSALPGITTGVMLSVGRSLGETAVLLFTAGAALRTPLSLFDSGRTMAVHFYILAREGISMPNAYGTAAVLVVSILAINLVAYTLMQRLMKRYS